MSSSLGFGEELLASLSIRLICVDRAGLGRSAPDPHKSFESYAADVAVVLATQDIARPAVVGFSQGAPFALGLAHAGIASTVALVSGQDELAHPATRRMLDAGVVALIEAVEADSAASEAELGAYADADSFWTMLLRSSGPTDRAVYDEPRFAAACIHALREGFAQGPAGYARDVVLALKTWPMRPESIRTPVALWYGKLDRSAVHSPDCGETLSARLPNATLHSEPDHGGAMLWTKSEAILKALG
jgi:pimeloyl-ACP methyl ester carboxylesterase